MALVNFKRETLGRIMTAVEKTERIAPRQWNQARRNWPLGIGGGTTTTILRGTPQEAIGPGETGTIQNLNVLSGSWDTGANPTVEALLPTVAFEITQEAVDAAGAVWVIQLSDNSWEIINAECVKDETGWGAASLSASEADTDIGIPYNPIDQADTVDVALRNVTYNTTNGEFSFQQKGIWDIGLQLNFQHNEQNQSRQTSIRVWDVALGSQIGNTFPISVSRNQPSTQLYLQFPAEIDTSALNDNFRFEIGGFDTLTNIVWTQVELQFNKKPGSGDFVT